MAQIVKNLPERQETLGREYPLKKGMATHSSIFAWRIPWTKHPVQLQSMGSQRVGHTLYRGGDQNHPQEKEMQEGKRVV